MQTPTLSDQVSGKTIRFSWTDGPTKGTTQEHFFGKNGKVEWHSIEASDGKSSKSGGGRPVKKPEKPHYAAEKVTDDVCMVSYLSDSGYTLTAALNFGDHSISAIASNEKTWLPAHGKFEVIS